AVRRGLLRMLDALQPGDRVALVTYADQAAVAIAEADAVEDREALEAAIEGLLARGATNLYDGLYTAFGLAERWRTPGRQSRVVLLSDGVATAGLEQPARLKALAEAYARLGVGITTIGVGTDFDVDTMRELSEVGAGNFYFLDDPAAVEEVFVDEVATFLVPVALDVEIDVQVGQGYLLRGAYGTNAWEGGLRAGRADIPSLFLAGRQQAAAPIEDGRRGGGGGIIVELMPLRDQSGVRERELVGTVSMTWTDPMTGDRLEQSTRIISPHAAGELPEQGFFTNATVEKGFVMLNLLVGFQLASQLAYDADVGTAIGVLDALRMEVRRWLQGNPDPDIEDDLRYVDLFISVLQRQQSQTPVSRPPEPWPVD
ncbi:MAG: VWA domain-containing protein, partial [Myxococcales bacterium]|nr:VWA domain-containing protein [Myxococcales bacterium]